MNALIPKDAEHVTGELSGWDRIVFRGYLRMPCFADGMMGYWIDPRFGFMSARIQNWFPFSVQVCVNGREWLSRRMDDTGLQYERYDSGFPWIGDFAIRLYGPKSADRTERGRIASKVSYRLRILRAHGLIRKSPKRRRYHMTTKGRQIVTTLLQAQHATLQQLNALAA